MVKEVPVRLSNIPDDLFLFRLQNQHYVMGESDTVSGAATINQALQFFLMFFVMIGLPLAVMIIVLVGIVKGFSFFDAALILGMALLSCAYMSVVSYRKGKQLVTSGRIALGEVTAYDTRMSFSKHGYKPSIRMHYQFAIDEGKQVSGSKLVGVSDTLRDGRKLPDVGTSLVILYTGENWHSPI